MEQPNRVPDSMTPLKALSRPINGDNMIYYAWKNAHPSATQFTYSFVYPSIHAVILCFGSPSTAKKHIEAGDGKIVALELSEVDIPPEDLKKAGLLDEALDKKGNGKKAHKTITPTHRPSEPAI